MSMNAPSCRAFAREEASWRNMLVSQPPISRIDWWHQWVHNDSAVGDIGSSLAGSKFYRHDGAAYGWGHQDQSRVYVTLGMLWDLVESRMVRGCTTRVQFLPDGLSVFADPHAHEEERYLVAEDDLSRYPYGAATPRVKITTHQVRSKVPWTNAGFDTGARKWVTINRDMPDHYAGDGFNILRADCQHDGQEPTRWSKSDGFQWSGLDGESSGLG